MWNRVRYAADCPLGIALAAGFATAAAGCLLAALASPPHGQGPGWWSWRPPPFTSHAPARRVKPQCLTGVTVFRPIKETGEMADLVFVVLTVAIFALLGLLVKAVGRL